MVSRFNDELLLRYCLGGHASVSGHGIGPHTATGALQALAATDQLQLLLEMLGTRALGSRKWLVIVPVEVFR